VTFSLPVEMEEMILQTMIQYWNAMEIAVNFTTVLQSPLFLLNYLLAPLLQDHKDHQGPGGNELFLKALHPRLLLVPFHKYKFLVKQHTF
jgi:hypothetical protein